MYEQYLADPALGERELAGLLRRLPPRRRPQAPPTPAAGPAPATAARGNGAVDATNRCHHRGRPQPRARARGPAPTPRAAAEDAKAAARRRRRGRAAPGRGRPHRRQHGGEPRTSRPPPASARSRPSCSRSTAGSSTATSGRTRGGKVSFTHLIGYAVVRAIAETVPVMNSTLHRGRRRQAAGSSATSTSASASPSTWRSPTAAAPCWSRSSSDADTLDFRASGGAYEELIRKVRSNKLVARRLRRRHRHPHQPGHASAPCSRCPGSCPARACIVGVGAIDYPAAYAGADPAALADLGVSKVITITSTYDHRIIQGAESGLFLQRVHELLLGADGFYDDVFRSPRRALRGGAVAARRQPASTASRPLLEKQMAVDTLIHMLPGARPPHRRPRPAARGRSRTWRPSSTRPPTG